MAFDSIKAGLKVVTRIGQTGGTIDRIVRHPVTRSVLAVVIAPEGVTDSNDYIVTSARNLRVA